MTEVRLEESEMVLVMIITDREGISHQLIYPIKRKEVRISHQLITLFDIHKAVAAFLRS